MEARIIEKNSKLSCKQRPLLDENAKLCDAVRLWNRESRGFRITEKIHRPKDAQNVRIEEGSRHGCCADVTAILKKQRPLRVR